MKQIQISCTPSNWDNSTITAVGMTRNGRRALPVTTVASELPETWLTVWHGLVDSLKGVAPGQWAATFIVGEMVEEEPFVHLTIHRKWDDQTTAEPVRLNMESAEAVAFFEHLTRDEQ